MNRRSGTIAVAGLGLLIAGPAIADAAGWLFEPVPGCLRSAAWASQPGLIWLHVIGDALITAAYIGIPTVLILIWKRLRMQPEAKLLYLFGAFIVFCGVTHLDDVIAMWAPVYRYTGAIKLLTGLVSLATFVALVRLFPQLVSLGGMAADLQAARDEADALRQKAEARAVRAEDDVHALAQAQADLQAAKRAAEQRAADADRMRRDALDSAAAAERERRRVEEAQAEKRAMADTVRELSTPVLPIVDRVIVLPLIGTVDSMRAEQAIDAIMRGVMEHQAEVVILDLTGVPVVDTQVANALLKAAGGVSLLGGRCILTGIRPAVAQTMIDLGINMTMIATKGTLRAGLATAMGMVSGR